MVQYLVFIGAGINLYGSIFYIKDTLAGKTKPNRITWLLWSLAPIIAGFASLSSGSTLSTVTLFSGGLLPLAVFFASFVNKNAYWELKKFDYICGGLSLLALILWGITQQPAIAVMLVILSDALAAAPTVKKIYSYPETETMIEYLTALISGLTGLFAVVSWSFSESAFILYFILINAILYFANYKNLFAKNIYPQP